MKMLWLIKQWKLEVKLRYGFNQPQYQLILPLRHLINVHYKNQSSNLYYKNSWMKKPKVWVLKLILL